MGYSVVSPPVVIAPILFPEISQNQILPSGPEAMPPGKLAAVGTSNSVILAGRAGAARAVTRSAPTLAFRKVVMVFISFICLTPPLIGQRPTSGPARPRRGN